MTVTGSKILASCLATTAFACAAAGQTVDPTQPPEGAQITERLDELLPLDLQFIDENGRTVSLGTYFERGVPVVLTPVYYRCPNICTALLTGLAEAANGIDWSAGREFEIVTFSFDPAETYPLAEVKKRNYLTVYERETAAAGWHFLVDRKSVV